MEPTQDNQAPATPPRPGALVMPSDPVVAAAPSTEPVIETAPVAPAQPAPVVEPAPVLDEVVEEPEVETISADEHGMDLEDIDTEDGQDEEMLSEEPAFQWQASEYVQHHKGMGWYAALLFVVVAMIGVAVWTQQWLSIAVILAMAAAIVVYANKAPRTLMYTLDTDGISIDGKEYAYEQFRSFAVLQDESWHAIDLEPTQRFMPRLTVIFDSEDLDGITEHLSLHLPRADRQPDLVERLTRYLRF